MTAHDTKPIAIGIAIPVAICSAMSIIAAGRTPVIAGSYSGSVENWRTPPIPRRGGGRRSCQRGKWNHRGGCGR